MEGLDPSPPANSLEFLDQLLSCSRQAVLVAQHEHRMRGHASSRGDDGLILVASRLSLKRVDGSAHSVLPFTGM
jgi:hypothetical protein